MSGSMASEEGAPGKHNPVNTEGPIATLPVPCIQHLLSDEPVPPVSSAGSAAPCARSFKVSDCILCSRVKYDKRRGTRTCEKLSTSTHSGCQRLLQVATLRKDERILARLQRGITVSGAHNMQDTIKYHRTCFRNYAIVRKRAASDAGSPRGYAAAFDKLCSTVIEPRIICGHENVAVSELRKLYDRLAMEDEEIDFRPCRKHRLIERLKARYPKQIKFVNVKRGYPEVVVNASDHTIQPDILFGIKWKKSDLQELLLAEPDDAEVRENRTEDPGSIHHADSEPGEEVDDISPCNSIAPPATHMSGGSLVSQEQQAEGTASRDEPCHLSVNRAVYDRWCTIRTAERLETDTDLAQLFIRQYEQVKTQMSSSSLCTSCNLPLQLYCPACESSSLGASEGRQLPTDEQGMQSDLVKRGQGRPGTKRGGVADRAAESSRAIGESVAERVQSRARKSGTADNTADDSDKIVVESATVSHCDESDCGGEDNSITDIKCLFEHLPDEEEVAELNDKLEGTESFGTNINKHLEVSALASDPDRRDYLQFEGDCTLEPVQDNALSLMEESSSHSQEENLLQRMEDNSPVPVVDISDLSKEGNSVLSEEDSLQCMEDPTVQSKGNSTTQDSKDGSMMQREETNHVQLVQYATCTDQHQPLNVSFPQRKTRSSSRVPACYSVPQQKAVKSAAESRKQKKKTKNKRDLDSDSDWDPSEVEPSHRKKKKDHATHHACKFCLQIFSSLQEFTTHLTTHKLQSKDTRKRFKCDHCESGFDNVTSFFKHVKEHKGGMPFSCGLCSLCFMSSEDRDRHKEAHACGQCGKVYNSLEDLKIHMLYHPGGKRPFKCNSCGQGFTQEAALWRHLYTACSNSDCCYICEICAAVFKSGTGLKSHIKCHSDEKPFACTVCGACFRWKCSLNAHLRHHSGERPHVCELCGKAFPVASDLRSHKRVSHYKEKPYKCHLCEYACSVRSSLTVHIRRHHSGEKPFKCKYCSYAFPDRADLVSHTRTHTGEKPYSCEQCNASFARRDYLAKHRALHTGHRPFVCSLCGKGFIQSSALKKHSEKSHCSAAQ